MNIRAHIERLIAAGVDPAEAGSIAAEIYAAGVSSASIRSSGAERTRRWREAKASQNVTKRHDVTHDERPIEASQNVTQRHKASQCDVVANSPIDTNIKNSKRRDSERPSRGTRIDPAWTPSTEDRAAALAEGFSNSEIDREALRFRDYWIAASGSNAVKRDWPATWRNWVRRSAETLGKTPRPQAPVDGAPSGPQMFEAKFGSEELDAWDAYGRAKTGKSFPRNKSGGWLFPTQWPPGYVPMSKANAGPPMARMQSMDSVTASSKH